MPLEVGREGGGEDDERVPLFGTWARIYAAVVLTNVAFMVLIHLFDRWKH